MLKRIRFVDDPGVDDKQVNNDIPEDDGHQMSQSEIDNLIAMLLNQ